LPDVTGPTADENAVVDPTPLLAVTRTRIRYPWSLAEMAYVRAVAPLIADHDAPPLFERSHW
jgi:hypothetical protein